MGPAGKTFKVIEAATDGSATLVAVTVIVVGDAILPGGVYSPALLKVPTDGLMLQVTDVLLAPLTKAVSCCGGAPTWICSKSCGKLTATPVSTTSTLADALSDARVKVTISRLLIDSPEEEETIYADSSTASKLDGEIVLADEISRKAFWIAVGHFAYSTSTDHPVPPSDRMSPYCFS
jgi:hypothetical protein